MQNTSDRSPPFLLDDMMKTIVNQLNTHHLKMQFIREEINQGCYQINSTVIAQRLLEEQLSPALHEAYAE